MKTLIIGEAVIDIITSPALETAEHPGGSPANVAIGLNRLNEAASGGRSATLLTMVGDDSRGQTIRQWLDSEKLDVLAAPSAHTATAKAQLDEFGASTYTFDMVWDLSELPGGVAGLDLSVFSHLHTGSIASYISPGASAVTELLTRGREHTTISYDPNIRPALIDDVASVRERVLENTGLSDIVKCSDEDLAFLFETEVPSEQDVIGMARSWVHDGASLVVVTRGADGVVLVGASGATVSVPAVETTVVDTVGAGDSFMGALIYQLEQRGLTGAANRALLRELTSLELRDIAEFASRVAGITVSRAGANPPSLSELSS